VRHAVGIDIVFLGVTGYAIALLVRCNRPAGPFMYPRSSGNGLEDGCFGSSGRRSRGRISL
jgi:hypothetical protein